MKRFFSLLSLSLPLSLSLYIYIYREREIEKTFSFVYVYIVVIYKDVFTHARTHARMHAHVCRFTLKRSLWLDFLWISSNKKRIKKQKTCVKTEEKSQTSKLDTPLNT